MQLECIPELEIRENKLVMKLHNDEITNLEFDKEIQDILYFLNGDKEEVNNGCHSNY